MGTGSSTLAVSFHRGDSASGIRNIRAFPHDAPPFDLLGPGAPATVLELREPRAFVVGPDGHLYVADGLPPAGAVLRLRPSTAAGPPWLFDRVFTTTGISHPFDLCFWPDGTLFVSNQNSGTVTSYDRSGTNGPVTVTGLHEVRGLATDGTRLYVAESGHGRVRTYDADGTHVGDIAATNPVHLHHAANGWLWIGCESADEIRAYDVGSPGSEPVRVVHGSHSGLDDAGGLCVLDGAGSSALLVASRRGRQVRSFPITFGEHGAPEWRPRTSTVVLDGLTDRPEFVAVAPER